MKTTVQHSISGEDGDHPFRLYAKAFGAASFASAASFAGTTTPGDLR